MCLWRKLLGGMPVERLYPKERGHVPCPEEPNFGYLWEPCRYPSSLSPRSRCQPRTIHEWTVRLRTTCLSTMRWMWVIRWLIRILGWVIFRYCHGYGHTFMKTMILGDWNLHRTSVSTWKNNSLGALYDCMPQVFKTFHWMCNNTLACCHVSTIGGVLSLIDTSTIYCGTGSGMCKSLCT